MWTFGRFRRNTIEFWTASESLMACDFNVSMCFASVLQSTQISHFVMCISCEMECCCSFVVLFNMLSFSIKKKNTFHTKCCPFLMNRDYYYLFQLLLSPSSDRVIIIELMLSFAKPNHLQNDHFVPDENRCVDCYWLYHLQTMTYQFLHRSNEQ